MASWEDRFIRHLEAIDDLIGEAKKANAAAADDLQEAWDDADAPLTAVQDVLIAIDEGQYGDE